MADLDEILSACASCEVHDDIVAGPPEILNYRSAVVASGSGGGGQKALGAFDTYGNLIVGAALLCGKERKLSHVNPSHVLDISPTLELPSVANIYWGGCIVGHHGHFIMDVLPRWWAFARYREAGYRIGLTLVGITEHELFSLRWFVDFLSLLGLGRDDIHVFRFMTRVQGMVVAGPMLVDRNYYHQGFAEFFEAIGRKAESLVPEDAFRGEYYLSRSRLGSGTRKVVNEVEIERMMARNGVEVLYPEELSIYEQIALFRRGRAYGFLSSAFHNGAFSRSPRGLCFSLDKEINRSYALFDSAVDARVDYVHVEHDYVANVPHFFVSAEVTALERLENTLHAFRNGVLPESRSYRRAVAPEGRYDRNLNGPFFLSAYFDRLAFFDASRGVVAFDTQRARMFRNVCIYVWNDIAFLCTNIHAPEERKIFVVGMTRDDGDDQVSFRSLETGKYMSAEGGVANGTLVCDRPHREAWEKFRLVGMDENDDVSGAYFARMKNEFAASAKVGISR